MATADSPSSFASEQHLVCCDRMLQSESASFAWRPPLRVFRYNLLARSCNSLLGLHVQGSNRWSCFLSWSVCLDAIIYLPGAASRVQKSRNIFLNSCSLWNRAKDRDEAQLKAETDHHFAVMTAYRAFITNYFRIKPCHSTQSALVFPPPMPSPVR